MNSGLIDDISIKSMNAVDMFKPNFSRFNNGKKFSDLYYSNQTFFQVAICDRTENIYNSSRLEFFLDYDEVKEFKNLIKQYNERLQKVQTEIALKELGSEYLLKDYLYFARVGQNLGLCHIQVIERNKEVEEAKEAEARREMYDDIDCLHCGDGGCIHCEPNRFVDGYIY